MYCFQFSNFHLVLIYTFHFFAKTLYISIHLKSFALILENIFYNCCVTVSWTLTTPLSSHWVFVDFLFPCELRFSWFFICQISLDCIQAILGILWWDSGSYLSPMENVYFCFTTQLISDKSSVACDFNGSFVFKFFAMLFWSVPCGYHPVTSLRLRRWFIT